jgi:hypothetical protein
MLDVCFWKVKSIFQVAVCELLIKKLQMELQIERQYNQALELHVRTLTQAE